MRFYIENGDLAKVAKILSTVSTNETKVSICLGRKTVEDKLLCDARITALGEQVMVMFSTKKPDDYTGEAVELIAMSQQLLSEIELLLTFGADVYFNISDEGVSLGVEGKTEIGEATLAEGTEPIKVSDYLCLFDAEGEKFSRYAKIGLLYSSDTVSANGTQNAVMVLNTETGALLGYSSDGAMVARASGQVTVKKADPGNPGQVQMQQTMDANMEKFIEAQAGNQSKEALKINVPYSSVRHLLTLTEGCKAWTAAVTDKHVVVNAGSVQYTFLQGAVAPVGAEQINALFGAPAGTSAAFDNEELSKGVGFINKIASLRKVEKPVLKLNVRQAGLTASTGVSDEMTADVKESAFDGEDTSVRVDGRKLYRALASLSKGVMNIRFASKYAILSNGDIASPDESGQIALFFIRDKAVEAPAPEKKDEDSGTDDGGAGSDETTEE